jgi:hypothetical protein
VPTMRKIETTERDDLGVCGEVVAGLRRRARLSARR